MKPSEIAAKYNVTSATVRRWVVNGVRGVRLRATRVGGGYRIDEQDLLRWFAECGQMIEQGPQITTMQQDSPENRERRRRQCMERLKMMGVN